MIFNFLTNKLLIIYFICNILLIVNCNNDDDDDIEFTGPTTDKGKWFESRWNRWKALSAEQKQNVSVVVDICGAYDLGFHCTKFIGQSGREGTNCDHYCCAQGYISGYCDNELSINMDVIRPLQRGKHTTNNVVFGAVCRCSNDWKDVSCKSDDGIFGIECPNVLGTCDRHCCRKRYDYGRCEGRFGLQCNCYNKTRDHL
ncbi:uncharacterized protein LOC128955471 [Oppia nitens]|uniref:uncharacterized protein LOC128955471 n=1 Tax=Oppia nitens TaxID=1686743 RepID=UPI0023DC230B|nr:uncharacterized protein LOC128955471 [Oppia nitens]